MDIAECREYCLSLPGTTEGFPFGDEALVFKVRGKMYCLFDVPGFEYINVKCDPEKAIELREEYPFVTPGYHMSKKHWNTIQMGHPVSGDLIKEWILDSYRLVVAKLPKKDRAELNI